MTKTVRLSLHLPKSKTLFIICVNLCNPWAFFIVGVDNQVIFLYNTPGINVISHLLL